MSTQSRIVPVLVLIILTGHLRAEPAAWLRFNAPDNQKYLGTPYHFLGDSPLYLTIAIKPTADYVLDLLWGAKNDQRAAILIVNNTSPIAIKAGDYNDFQWQRIQLPAAAADTENYQITLKPDQPKAAFLAAIRLTTPDTPPDGELPPADSHLIQLTSPPPTQLELWARELQNDQLAITRRAFIHGRQANEALRRCRKYVDGWLSHTDPTTGLIPRNLSRDKNLWNGKDAAADNYAFMVLTAALTDRALYQGRMLDILHTETRIATQANGLPAQYDFDTRKHRYEKESLDSLIFNGSEYVKDGLMPITEWLGPTPWSQRMTAIIDSILDQAPFETPFGRLPSNNVEVNGEMMQVLSRLYFNAGNTRYLDMACRIADYYLLGDHHPTRDFTELGLRDHNCELISGLTEVYAACHTARPAKARAYRQPIQSMLDDILKYGRNEYGLMYQTINPRTGAVLNPTIHDNWGYNYNGFYTVYLLDREEPYRQATRLALSNLKDHYWKFPWEGQSADGIADSVEGALNLFNREPDSAGVPDWIDANINRMLDIQKPDGTIEGWHGDGNYARTAIMWALWKQQGVTIQPWRDDVCLGAVCQDNRLHLSLIADQPWSGVLIFDQPRYRAFMKLPLDYPRINQFPQWFTVEPAQEYQITTDTNTPAIHPGARLIDGLPIQLTPNTLLQHLTVQRLYRQ